LCLREQNKNIKKKPTKVNEIILKEGEIIKPIHIEQYKDNYLITNYGRCFSKRTGKELKPQEGGYKRIHLRSETSHELFLIHFLVYCSFTPLHI